MGPLRSRDEPKTRKTVIALDLLSITSLRDVHIVRLVSPLPISDAKAGDTIFSAIIPTSTGNKESNEAAWLDVYGCESVLELAKRYLKRRKRGEMAVCL